MKLFVGYITDAAERKKLIEYHNQLDDINKLLQLDNDEDYGYNVVVIEESLDKAFEKIKKLYKCEPVELKECPKGVAATGILGDEWCIME